MEQLKALTGIDVIIVTHEGGGDLLINVLNGTLDVGVGEIQELVGQIEAGEIKLLASYTRSGSPPTRTCMTAREQGIDLVVDKFRGLAGPKGLPEDVIAAWEQAIPLLLETPGFKAYYRGGRPGSGVHAARRVRPVHRALRRGAEAVHGGVRHHRGLRRIAPPDENGQGPGASRSA